MTLVEHLILIVFLYRYGGETSDGSKIGKRDISYQYGEYHYKINREKKTEFNTVLTIGSTFCIQKLIHTKHTHIMKFLFHKLI